jgi:glycine C-acetyltransferase
MHQMYTPEGSLSGSMRDFRVPQGSDILARVEGFYRWQDTRRRGGLWPFCRSTDSAPTATCGARDDRGEKMRGVNFASQDYLSLSSHPVIKDTAKQVIEQYGVHSAGSPALVGNTIYSVDLERRIAAFLDMEEVVLFPTGWAAGFGAIRGLVRSSDYVVIDALAHTCLQEGTAAATRNVAMFRHLDVGHCRERLQTIRARDTQCGIMVVTESLFSMDSDTPDLKAMQDLCDEFNATLMVDVAHDLGCLGEDGRGHIGMQDMLGKIDIVMGSFSKTFASNGGFVACKTRAVKEYLNFYSPPCTFSNALSPVQAAVVGKAFEIVASGEGRERRSALLNNVLHLRSQLGAAGMVVYGSPSAIVAVKMGAESLARLVSRQLPEQGLIANLVEYPAVAKGAARFRMQVMAEHTWEHVEQAVQRLKAALEAAKIELALVEEPEPLRATA